MVIIAFLALFFAASTHTQFIPLACIKPQHNAVQLTNTNSFEGREGLQKLEDLVKANTPALIPFEEFSALVHRATMRETGNPRLRKFQLAKDIHQFGPLALYYTILNKKNDEAIKIVETSHRLKRAIDMPCALIDLYDKKHAYNVAIQLFNHSWSNELYPISTGCLQWMLSPTNLSLISTETKDAITSTAQQFIQKVLNNKEKLTNAESRLIKTTHRLLKKAAEQTIEEALPDAQELANKTPLEQVSAYAKYYQFMVRQ
jgi:hypothetical protein